MLDFECWMGGRLEAAMFNFGFWMEEGRKAEVAAGDVECLI